MGFEVEIPGTLQGRSGISQKFGLVFRLRSQTGLVTVVKTGDAMDELALRGVFTSVFDCSPSFHVVIAIPNAGESVRKLATQYKAHLIEGGDLKSILRLFRSYAIGIRSSTEREQRQTGVAGTPAVTVSTAQQRASPVVP